VFSALALGASTLLAHADWKPIQILKTYAVSGKTESELYASIGEHGPKAGSSRAIALTTFKLTWTRDYQRQGDACTLVTALPKLTITTILPKNSQPLPGPVKKRWETFVAGVQKHERVHGVFIEDMVRQIEAFTVGLTVDADPQCSKIRSVMKERLSELSQAQRQKSRDFDRDELSDGGTVHRLIIDFLATP